MYGGGCSALISNVLGHNVLGMKKQVPLVPISIRRVQLASAPFATPSCLARVPWDPLPAWPCRWLAPPAAWALPLTLVYRLRLRMDAPLRSRIHVSADERYELFCDGQRVGRGPERCDERCWSYESYDVELDAGEHLLLARVWALSGLAPWAQRSRGPGFLCCPQDELAQRLLGTGLATWEVARLGGYTFVDPSAVLGTGVGYGAAETLDAVAHDWAVAVGKGDASAWAAPVPGDAGNNGFSIMTMAPIRLLRPAALPAQLERPWTRWRLTEGSDGVDWAALLAGGSVTVPLRTRGRALIDLDDYVCGYVELSADRGAGARIALGQAEGLHAADGTKLARDAHAGGTLRCAPDVLLADGGTNRRLAPRWWRAGGWLELTVETAEEALTLRDLRFTETGYPFERLGGAVAPDEAWATVFRQCERTWRACAHETYMDCPFYEQLMYVGDTRVQALITYALTADDRLPIKALRLFDSGRCNPTGMIPDAWPANGGKLIPPFSLWWVGMLHDFASWRGDHGVLAGLLPGLRSLMERFLALVSQDGLMTSPDGWNYMDWVPGTTHGVGPGGEEGGQSGFLNWQLIHALDQWAGIEDLCGEPELAARARRRAAAVHAALDRTMWDEGRGLYAETAARGVFSEHSQCLALLSGRLDAQRSARVADGLFAGGLLVASCYFSHYLFEVCRVLGRADVLRTRLQRWFALAEQGYRTTPEAFGNGNRSDCHAWSAHPLFHWLTTIIGARPAALGFAAIEIAPLLGDLPAAAGTLAHPLGPIAISLTRDGTRLRADINLPAGLPGTLRWNGRTIPLQAGSHRYEA